VEVTGKVERLRELCDGARAAGDRVGFVPTMGGLHDGHLSLLRRARDECGLVVLSVFVNPLQFGAGEDYRKYPRDLTADSELAEKEGVDLVFAPDDTVMYPTSQPSTWVDPGPVGDVLEGASRPGHFRGVCTVVAKLFNMVGPCNAYFGEKDFQQLVIVRRLVNDLDFPVDIEAGPTVREPDGLAMSSRNAFLSTEERRAATCLFRALTRAAEVVAHGERDANVVKAEMARVIGAEPLARIDYVAVVGQGNGLTETDRIEGPARALVAARFGATRLIDNMRLPMP
jgi:pantoate--beta-alanine ligase